MWKKRLQGTMNFFFEGQDSCGKSALVSYVPDPEGTTFLEYRMSLKTCSWDPPIHVYMGPAYSLE